MQHHVFTKRDDFSRLGKPLSSERCVSLISRAGYLPLFSHSHHVTRYAPGDKITIMATANHGVTKYPAISGVISDVKEWNPSLHGGNYPLFLQDTPVAVVYFSIEHYNIGQRVA